MLRAPRSMWAGACSSSRTAGARREKEAAHAQLERAAALLEAPADARGWTPAARAEAARDVAAVLEVLEANHDVVAKRAKAQALAAEVELKYSACVRHMSPSRTASGRWRSTKYADSPLLTNARATVLPRLRRAGHISNQAPQTYSQSQQRPVIQNARLVPPAGVVSKMCCCTHAVLLF